jgi:curved DNA-binding protein CbpA
MMSRPGSDPYAVLGVTPQVSDDELRRAYRTLIKRHHPDHNGGSPASTVRFAQIQDAYARVAQARRRLWTGAERRR